MVKPVLTLWQMLKLPLITDVCSPQSSVTADVPVCADVCWLQLYRADGESDTDQLNPRAVLVTSVGSEAARMLDDAASGRVLAVFERSFYVQYDEAVFCIGVASLGQGPLHLLIASDVDSLPWSLAPGCRVRLVGGSLNFIADGEKEPDHFDGDKRAVLYHGRIAGIALTRWSLKNTQALFELLVPSTLHGFGGVLTCSFRPDDQGIRWESIEGLDAIDRGLRRQCFPAVQCLHHWLDRSLDARVGSVVSDKTFTELVPTLLGAGPGLTPAGDDLLAGVMLALHRIRRTDLSDCLWQVLEPRLHDRTNLISAAHLRLAARGQCSEPVRCLIEHLVDSESAVDHPDTLRAQASALQTMANQIGASSGWDMLAGTSLVLRALRAR